MTLKVRKSKLLVQEDEHLFFGDSPNNMAYCAVTGSNFGKKIAILGIDVLSMFARLECGPDWSRLACFDDPSKSNRSIIT